MEFVETILRDAQKMGQSRLRSFLASLGTVPIFGLALGFSAAPQSRLRSFLASLGTVPIFGLVLGFSPAPLSPIRPDVSSKWDGAAADLVTRSREQEIRRARESSDRRWIGRATGAAYVGVCLPAMPRN